MNDHYDDASAERFGPEYVRPANADCPNCLCCTAALCERGRASFLMCTGHVDDAHRAVVALCPCSSQSATGSLAWQAMRIRAVTLATEKPLTAPLERMMSAGAHGQALDDEDSVRQLIARGLIAEDTSGLTEYGRLYLAARTEPRQVTTVLIVDVDERTRTARVAVTGRPADRPVTVPMDQLANGHTKLLARELPGVVLHAQANCAAERDEDVVLTQVRNPRARFGADSAAAAFAAGRRAAGGTTAQGAPDGDA